MSKIHTCGAACEACNPNGNLGTVTFTDNHHHGASHLKLHYQHPELLYNPSKDPTTAEVLVREVERRIAADRASDELREENERLRDRIEKMMREIDALSQRVRI